MLLRGSDDAAVEGQDQGTLGGLRDQLDDLGLGMRMPIVSIGPPDAKIMIVVECPGADDVSRGRPLEGMAGTIAIRALAEAGIAVSACYTTLACRHRPPKQWLPSWMPDTKKGQTDLLTSGEGVEFEGRIIHQHLRDGILHLRREIDLVKPSVIIALGNGALYALTGHTSVAKWRGSTLPASGSIVVPTYHPTSVLRQWSLRPIVVQDLRRAAACLIRPPVKPEWSFLIRPTLSQVREAIERLHTALDLATSPMILSTDIETRAGHIACLGIASSPLEAFCVPFLCVERPSGYWDEDEEAEIVFLLYRVLTHRNALVVGQNFIYDTQYIFRHWGFVPRFGGDTMVAFHVCFPGMPKSLDHIASMLNDYYIYWKDDGKEWDKGADQDEDKYWTYNCEDCVRTYEAYVELQRVVDRMGLRGPHNFQQALFYPVLRTMVRGVRIDATRQKAMRKKLKDHADACLALITSLVGHELNPKSPKQMCTFFYEELGLPVQKDRKTKSPTANDAALDTFHLKVPYLRPLIEAIKEYRSCETVASNALKASAVGFDGRMHCSYNVTGTVTFRFSSREDAFGSGMNLQNITAGDGDDY